MAPYERACNANMNAKHQSGTENAKVSLLKNTDRAQRPHDEHGRVEFATSLDHRNLDQTCPVETYLQGEDLRRAQEVNERNKGKHVLHKRSYQIDAVVENDTHFRLIGHLRDVSPDGLWGIEDTEPMTLHHMQLELVIEAATLTITEVDVFMHVHPNRECPQILPKYDQLIGLSIARGFTNKIREFFGGPRGCTHIGALVNAMAPVALQTLWAFSGHIEEKRRKSKGSDAGPAAQLGQSEDGPSNASRLDGFSMNRNTCHIWAEDGPMFELRDQNKPIPVGLWAEKRLNERGIPVTTWSNQH